MSEQEVERHNRGELWRDVSNHLTVARESLEQAQGALDDLGLPSHAEQLQEHVDAIRRAANDAEEEASTYRPLVLDRSHVGRRCVINSTNLSGALGTIVRVGSKSGQFPDAFADVKLDGGKTIYVSSGTITLVDEDET